MPDIKIRDLECAKYFKYKNGLVLDLTLAEFSERYLEFYTSEIARKMNVGYDDFLHDYVLKYMIEQGYVEPRLNDPISHAMISIPNRLLQIDSEYIPEDFPMSREGGITIGMLYDLYFGENGEKIRASAGLRTKKQRKLMQRLYSYLSNCEDLDSDTLATIYKNLVDCGAFECILSSDNYGNTENE
jgi:hypothetical protein